MLSRIFIQNFALIDSLELQLGAGLQVITGETGAGKSIILGALRLLMGERADVKSTQNNETKSVIEGEFILHENLKPFFIDYDLDYETHTIIRRELLPNGKSRAFVNDVPTTLEVLKKLSEQLVDIHSQFETSQLFSEKFQFEMIDNLGDNKNLVKEYQNEFAQYQNLKKQLQALEKQLQEGNNDTEYKNFLLNELQQAELDDVEVENLENQLALYQNAEQISENLKAIFNRTDQDEVGVIDALLDIKNRLSKTAELSHQFSECEVRMDALFLELKDLVFELQNKAEKIEISPEVLQQLTDKLNVINHLTQKHRVATIDDLLQIRENLQSEQSGLEGLQENINSTQKEIAAQEDKLNSLAEKIAVNRKKYSVVFVEKMELLLQQLGLEKAKLEVSLLPNPNFTLYGKENISILFQANTGFALKPIQNAISGGERSRVMLAVKKIMAENTALPTLILDEIDTGVSGKVADEMGKVMKEMSQDLQLIVISHLAQVAAKGDTNYKVIKSEVMGKTQSQIIPLSAEEKLQEIAQLLSGTVVTDAALQQAKELMK